jgi:exodeoxyribonuclease VII small subunit
MPKKKPTDPTDSAQPLEALIARLEEIAKLIQEGHVGLEESIALYEEGRRLAQLCTERLTAAQRKLEILSPVRSSGDFSQPDLPSTADHHPPLGSDS